MSAYTDITVTDFQNYFVRDFQYGSTQEYVMDQDVQNAIAEAQLWMDAVGAGLYGTQNLYTLCFLFLAAHNLVMNLRASTQGINGQFNYIQSGKGVGPVSESFAVPDWIKDDPNMNMLSKSNYGAKFLAQTVPLLRGQIFNVWGGTNP
jgi:hypothetical protein